MLPSNTQLMLPLLQALDSRGGAARPREIYDEIASNVGLSDEDRNATTMIGKQKVNVFERRLRWCRQTAVFKGLISKEEHSVWRLTEAANAKLGNMESGTVLTFAISETGALLWANAKDALSVIEKGSVSLLLTSPPYPLLNPKMYGGVAPDKWVGWLLELCSKWRELLTPDGSMMLNIGPCWKKGLPAQELHIERLLVKLEDELGIHLLQTLYWHSPTKLATPLSWVGVKRLRVTPSVEPVLWISSNPNAKGNNLHVLREYTEGGRRAIEKPRLSKRPSGFQFGANSFKDRGGSIPPSLITATPTGKEDARYRKEAKAAGLLPHPAVLPAAVARFGIQLATDVGDVVYDPMVGSGTVVAEALKLGRRAIGSERSLEYLEGAFLRCQGEQQQMERLLAA